LLKIKPQTLYTRKLQCFKARGRMASSISNQWGKWKGWRFYARSV